MIVADFLVEERTDGLLPVAFGAGGIIIVIGVVSRLRGCVLI
jgi:hypothetical protein